MKKFLLLIFFWACNIAFGQEQDFSLYGYFDLEFEYNSRLKKSTFDNHHLNFLPVFRFQQYRLFSELEFEHGAKFDPGGGEGHIAVERAWIEFLFRDYLQIRAGKFLTPFGIYNLVHDATPTFLTTSLPFIYSKHNPFGVKTDRLYAKLYTGLQLLGTLANEGALSLNYTIGVGNGRGPTQHSEDNDNNKSLSIRLILNAGEQMKFGFSHYRDRNAEGMSGRPRAMEQAWGTDVEFETEKWLLQSEVVLFRLEKLSRRNSFQSARSWYTQFAYRIRGIITPVARFDYFQLDLDKPDNHYRWLFGLNYSPNPQIYLKTEIHFNAANLTGRQDDKVFLSSISVAF